MDAPAISRDESPSPKQLRDLIEQLIGMVVAWDMGERLPSRSPVPPLNDYLKQCGAVDAQGNRINSPKTEQLVDHWFKLCDTDEKARIVKRTRSDPGECWPQFEALATQVGNVAQALGWPRTIEWRFLGAFDPRKVLPAGSQVSRYRILNVFLPPPADGHFEHFFDVEFWLPYPQAPRRPANWPPPPKIEPFRNDLVGRCWAMKNDDGKPQFLDLLRSWMRFAEAQLSADTAPKATPYRFRRRDGSIWDIGFDDEHGMFPEIKGFPILAQLLALQPNSPAIRAAELQNRPTAELTGHTRQDALDEDALTEYREQIAELARDIEAANASGDVHKASSLAKERDEVIAQLKKDRGRAGASRSLGTSPDDAARLAVHGCIKRAYEHLEHPKAGKGLMKLVRHLRESIGAEGCAYAYRPSHRPDWSL
jgi:hypothetical protein